MDPNQNRRWFLLGTPYSTVLQHYISLMFYHPHYARISKNNNTKKVSTTTFSPFFLLYQHNILFNNCKKLIMIMVFGSLYRRVMCTEGFGLSITVSCLQKLFEQRSLCYPEVEFPPPPPVLLVHHILSTAHKRNEIVWWTAWYQSCSQLTVAHSFYRVKLKLRGSAAWTCYLWYDSHPQTRQGGYICICVCVCVFKTLRRSNRTDWLKHVLSTS